MRSAEFLHPTGSFTTNAASRRSLLADAGFLVLAGYGFGVALGFRLRFRLRFRFRLVVSSSSSQ